MREAETKDCILHDTVLYEILEKAKPQIRSVVPGARGGSRDWL